MMKESKLKKIAGIDDLEGMFGDFVTEWWTDEDWAKWNADAPNRDKRNAERIAELKRTGEYGKEYYLTCSFMSHPLFDEPEYPKDKPLISSKYIIFDMNNPNLNNEIKE